MKDIEFEKALKALANKRRLSIVSLLKKKREMTVGDIANEIKLSFRSTSRHLKILSAANVVSSEQRKTFVFYKCDANSLKSVKNWMNSL